MKWQSVKNIDKNNIPKGLVLCSNGFGLYLGQLRLDRRLNVFACVDTFRNIESVHYFIPAQELQELPKETHNENN